MDARRVVSPESALASDIFDKFCTANTLKAILTHYRHLCKVIRLKPTHFPEFYPRLKAKLSSWRAQGLWSKFEKRASNKCYGRGKVCYGSRVLIIGAGPCGLRTAIEAQLLGAKVVVIEKRDRFSRNNVLHLWPMVIADLKALGAKKFYGKFCAGSIDHISIRQLQCILLKVALLLGVEVLEGVGFEGLLEPTDNEGWRASCSPANHPLSHYTFDVLIGADGRRNTLDGFKRKALRAKLAIAITANFINKKTEAEARVKEISGVSYIFNQKFFQELNEHTGIDLENIVYYKDETHYFVMTAKKQSLLNKGVLMEDHADTAKLLSHENISSDALMEYALEAAIFSTDNQLSNLEFAVNHYGQPDVAMFDFTAMYAAENACRVVQKKGHKLIMSLVGDSLLEPFWPTGSGCARGFLSSFDACWMLRSWCTGRSVLEVIAERESIYRLLGQTTPENLNKEHSGYTLDPYSRYPNLNLRVVMPFQVKNLYESDEPIELADGQQQAEVLFDAEKVSKKRRRDSVIAVDALLSWLREQVAGYDILVSDVCNAFYRGDVLCAILNRFRPDLIEFPFPIETEENLDPIEIAACRNQIAFDLFHEEHGLVPVMSGFESVQCTSSDFLTLVAYLSQIYEIFRGEIPQTSQMKYSRVESCEELDEDQRSSHSIPKPHYSRPALVVKHTTVGKPISRRSRSGRDESESSRKHKKRRSDDRSRAWESKEERENHRQEIEKNRQERQRRRMAERVLQTERFIKSMRLLQLNDRSGEISISSENGEPSKFEDYTFHLYRQMVPDFEDRVKFLERKLFNSGREVKISANCHLGPDKEVVSGLTRNLEEKLKGTRPMEKKPKDLIRAIGKIEKSDWNIQLIEKKIAENKSHCHSKKDRDDKVPKWSREAFDDKREAMKRKMEGTEKNNEKLQLFEETVKKLGNKLTEGNVRETGVKGANKVSQMAEKLVHKLERPKEESVIKSSVQRPFEFPKKGGSETCHFCNERVYVVERMTAEGKFFHSNCFRCEYCNRSFSKFSSNYVFDRDSRYGDRFYCTPHFHMIKMYGWKKYDQNIVSEGNKFSSSSVDGSTLLASPAQQQKILEDRGMTPERVEFENSVDFASEVNYGLSDMDEDEWTEKNFGSVSNADSNTSDDAASDLSDDDTPEGNEGEPPNLGFARSPEVLAPAKQTESSDSDTEVISGEEGSEEVSGDEENEQEEEEDESSSNDEEEEEDDEEEDEEGDEGDEDDEEEECGGSTTEIETDSEFAEDPPQTVPGKIPTIVVDEPEQLVTKIMDTSVLSHTRSPHRIISNKHSRKHHHHHQQQQQQNTQQQKQKSTHHHYHQNQPKVVEEEENEPYVDILQQRMVEPVPVTRNIHDRILPRFTNPVPKKWEPLSQDPNLASKLSLELKKKYLHGAISPINSGVKKPMDQNTGAQNQFRSVLDMISEQQKLLQPAAKPSATMQAFLDSSDKLKLQQQQQQQSGMSPLGCNSMFSSMIGFNHHAEKLSPMNEVLQSSNNFSSSKQQEQVTQGQVEHQKSPDLTLQEKSNITLQDMNRLNLEKTTMMKNVELTEEQKKKDIVLEEEEQEEEKNKEKEKGDYEKEIDPSFQLFSSSVSQSETDTQSTIVDNNKILKNENVLYDETQITNHHQLQDGRNIKVESPHESNQDSSDTEALSEDEEGEDLDDNLDEEDDDEDGNEVQIIRDPPRVEIEDEFGVSLNVDENGDEKKKGVGEMQKSKSGESESGLTSTSTSTIKNNSNTNNDDNDRGMGTDDDGIKSLGLSSSESKESLNSGMFLETEMSDWARDGGESGAGDDDEGHFITGKNRKFKRLKNKIQPTTNTSTNNNNLASSVDSDKGEHFEKYNKLKSSLTLDLAGFDFMDVDGISSPEDILILAPKKQGYCKLANEEIDDSDNDNIVYATTTTTTTPTTKREQEKLYHQNENDGKQSTTTNTTNSSSSRESTPTISLINDATNKLVIEQHEIIPLIKPNEIVEAINPIFENHKMQDVKSIDGIIKTNNNNNSSSSINFVNLQNKEQTKDNKKQKKFAILDRVSIPFAGARNSLDYRKMKNTTSPSKSKDLFSSSKIITTPTTPVPITTTESIEDSTIKPKTPNSSPPSSPPSSLPSSSSSNLQNMENLNNSQQQLDDSTSSNSGSSSGSIKSSTSPKSTAKRIAEINKERVKQSDLIRSMVMGRIRKSPEKNRRGSRGSLSPPLGVSSTSSTSGSSEQVMNNCKTDINIEKDVDSQSYQSSQHSIHTNSNTEDSHHQMRNPSSLAEVEASSIEEEEGVVVASSDDISHTATSSASSTYSNSNDEARIKHNDDEESNENIQSSINSSTKMSHTHYTPVFTSPRRPKFDMPFKTPLYTSLTNPSTPVNPNFFTPITPDEKTPSNMQQQSGTTTNSSSRKTNNKSPSFYRSMPDLTSFLVTPTSRQRQPSVTENWILECREKARQAARERARLKSDQELGLELDTDYVMYKDKLRRKISVPEDDVFDPNAAVVAITSKSNNSNTNNNNSNNNHHHHHQQHPHSNNNNNNRSNNKGARPLSDVFDTVASSIRHNVDFPIVKTNPFLVSPENEKNPSNSTPISPPPNKMDNFIVPSNDTNRNEEGGQIQQQFRHHHHELSPRRSIETDDFVHLNLRISQNHGTVNERRNSPEKVKSVGWDADSNDFPNYFTPKISTSIQSPTKQQQQQSQHLHDSNWLQQQQQQQQQQFVENSCRPRSNTFSESYIRGGHHQNVNIETGNTINTSSSSNIFAPSSSTTTASKITNASYSSARLPSSCSSTSILPNTNTNMNTSSSNTSKSSGNIMTMIESTPLTTTPVIIIKSKALSSDMLLDHHDKSSINFTPSDHPMHLSVPDKLDVNHSNISPDGTSQSSSSSFKNTTNKPPKDREGRRSIIQAVSDFFTSRSSPSGTASLPSSSDVLVADNSSSNSTSPTSGVTGGGNKDKFSLFKLTPKLLHKDRKSTSKSRETLSPLNSNSDYHNVATTPINTTTNTTPTSSNSKSPKTGFATYLSQPDMIIQRLSSSPTPFKSSRSNLNSPSRYDSESPQLSSTSSQQSYPDSSRMKKIHGMQLQLETIESEQRQLEIQGIAIERKLTAEEKVDENREEIEMMEEQWFTMVREKTRLARLAREISVSIKQLQLDEKLNKVQEKLNNSLQLSDIQKTPDQKVLETEYISEIRSLETQKTNLLLKFRDDVQKYESEDAELELKIASSSLSPRESNV